MNGFLIFGVVSLIGLYFLELVVELKNLRYARAHGVPPEFKDQVDESKYKESIRYLSTNTKFDLATGGVSLLITFEFWFVGGFHALDMWARHFEFGPITTGLIFIGGLMALSSLAGLPFSLYRTFKIEASFGFNRTTLKTFITDRIKGLILSVLIGAPIGAGILWFFQFGGDYNWLIAWGFLLLVQVLLLFLAPVFLLPLFNKFTPLPDGDLKRAIESYAQKEKFQISGIFTMDGSKRSSKANAFFTGFGKNRRIALFDTLLEKQTTDETVAVLAHEIGHAKLKHVIKKFLISAGVTLALFYALSLLIGNPELTGAFGVDPSVYASLVFAGFLYGPIGKLEGFFESAMSRKHEFEADDFAKKTTGKGEHLVTALKKLSVDNLANLNPHPWKVALEYSHPPTVLRIRALRA
jgi:STE24 endopeptidase